MSLNITSSFAYSLDSFHKGQAIHKLNHNILELVHPNLMNDAVQIFYTLVREICILQHCKMSKLDQACVGRSGELNEIFARMTATGGVWADCY